MERFLIIVVMVAALIFLGRQCEKTDQVEEESRAREANLKNKGQAMDFSFKRANKRTDHEDAVDAARDRHFNEQTDEARGDYMDAVQERYR